MNVHALWCGNSLTAMQWASMVSFIETGNDFYLYTDNLSRRVPPGVKVLPIPSYLPKKPWRFGPRAGKAKGSFAAFADLVRVEHLFHKGGWFTDLDVICLKKMPPLLECGLGAAWEDKENYSGARLVNVAVLGATPGHPAIRLLRRRVKYPWYGSPWQNPIRRAVRGVLWADTILRPWNVPWGFSGGPAALTTLLSYLKLADQMWQHDVFYPVPHRHWRSLLVDDMSKIEAITDSTVAVHLWAELYRQEGMDPNDAVENSWMKKYLNDWPGRDNM